MVRFNWRDFPPVGPIRVEHLAVKRSFMIIRGVVVLEQDMFIDGWFVYVVTRSECVFVRT